MNTILCYFRLCNTQKDLQNILPSGSYDESVVSVSRTSLSPYPNKKESKRSSKNLKSSKRGKLPLHKKEPKQRKNKAYNRRMKEHPKEAPIMCPRA